MKHERATKKRCKALFNQGWKLAAIASESGVDVSTLARWRDVEGWAVNMDPEDALDARCTFLIVKDEKTQGEWRELGRLMELRNKMIRRERKDAKAGDGPAAGKQGGRGKTGKAGADSAASNKNEIGHLNLAAIKGPPFWKYQREFLDDPARLRERIKGRQIGFTWTASWGGLTTAIETGRNQIFLSASKNQVGVFREYIKEQAEEYLGVELKGNKDRIELRRDGKAWATLYFLSTNTATAQSYHGDLWIDEACWIPSYETLRKVAGGMASQKRFRTTIFSTPSTIIHPAWQEFQRLQKQLAEKPNPQISLRTITLHDAIADGCDLFDLEALRAEYDDAAFAQLFECQPIDDEQSIFKLKDLEAICADPEGWEDAVDGLPVRVGYDPSRTTDNASLALGVKLPGPDAGKPKIRIFKRVTISNKSFRWQANLILMQCEIYNVEEIAIDVTGAGWAVYELVCEMAKEKGLSVKATAINYSLENKVHLVETVRHLVQEKRLELPLGDAYMLACFLAIRQTATGGGRVTYKASRTAETGHADLFFAIAHLCAGEKLGLKKGRAFAAEIA